MKSSNRSIYGSVIFFILVIFLVAGCGAKKSKVLESQELLSGEKTLTSEEAQQALEQADSRSGVGEGVLSGDILDESADENEKSDGPLTLEGLEELEKDMSTSDEEMGRVALRKETADDGFRNVVGLDSSEILPIYFGYDRCSFTDDIKKILRNNAERLDSKVTQEIILEGHTDERGSDEYNLALGECRSKSVLNYLSDFGVTVKLSTVSLGEEQPVCLERNEGCWSRNRRVEFKVVSE